MSEIHTSTMSLRRKLLIASGATIVIAVASAAPAVAQANGDTTGHATPVKTDTAVWVTPAGGSGGARNGAVIQMQMQFTPGKGGIVLQGGPATPAQPQQAPQIQVAGDSTKADSAKAAADTTKAAGKKP